MWIIYMNENRVSHTAQTDGGGRDVFVVLR